MSTERYSPQFKAFVGPFVLFMAFLVLRAVIFGFSKGHGSVLVAAPEYWIYPLQTLCCAGMLWHYWRHYEIRWPRGIIFTLLIATLVFLLWIAPQALLGREGRFDGFDPSVFADQPALYWTNLGFRFLRLVVVVPLVEEIFWRGFLLRYVIDPEFEKIPLGTFTWGSFAVVSIGFGLEHAGPDLLAGMVTGALYNWILYRTRSLASCVLAHAVTNFLLGLYIMRTGQWGFW